MNAHILHLACHGLQADGPLDSAFLLSDGKLTIQDLMSPRLTDAIFAFLSACQTAKGSEDLADQAVHLAASIDALLLLRNGHRPMWQALRFVRYFC
jgi:CHAT domain-containing protein